MAGIVNSLNGKQWDWKQTNLVVHLDGLGIKSETEYKKALSVQTETPIYLDFHSNYVCYYEAQILNKRAYEKKMFFGYSFGAEFDLNGDAVGQQNNSVSVCKNSNYIMINGHKVAKNQITSLKTHKFVGGDVIGVGILSNQKRQERKFFANLNGELIVPPQSLPQNFHGKELNLYPTATLRNNSEEFYTNFGGTFNFRGGIPNF